jgi:hypothetical protein
MARTQIGTTLIEDGSVRRVDINTTLSGSALITKLLVNSPLTISSTGVDSGTGDVTIGLSTANLVTSFNTRVGAVTLSGSDVTTALGFTPISGYTETDTLATVTNRGNSTTGRINVRGIGNQSGGNILMGNVGEGSSKWSYLTGTHFNATSQPQGFALIGGLSTTSYNAVVIGGNIYETNPATEIQFWTHNATTHTLGGTQRGIIDSVGNWGIGTNSPSAKLHVNGTFISNALWTDGTSIGYWGAYSTAYGGLTWDTGQATVYATSGNKLYLASNGSSPDLTIDTNSYVGIGSTSPSFKTTISADITKSGDINPGTAQLSLEGSTTPGKRMILGYDTNSNGFGFIKSGNYGVSWTPLSLQPDGGNVLVGTTTDVGYKLDVNGTGRFVSSLTANSFVKSGGTSAQFLKADGSVDSNTYLTSVTNISGYSGRLLGEDNRTISPSEGIAGQLKFGFTSWTNNNNSPYADFLHLRSYTDASGGLDNLVLFRKDVIGMRIYQQTWGSASAYSTFKDVAFTDSNITGNAATATTLQTARNINGTSFNGSGDITTAVWGNARTLTIGNTGKSVNGSGNVSWTLGEIQAEYQVPNNTLRNNLGDPTVREMAMFHGQFNNKFRFISPTLQEESTDGVTWTTSTRASAANLGDMMRGEGEGTSFNAIPTGTIGTYGGYRLTWNVVGTTGYIFLNALYVFNSTNGNNVTIKIEAYHNTNGWTTITGPTTTNNWPGHAYIPHSNIPYSNNASQYSQVRITFETTHNSNTNAFGIYSIEWVGGYPAGKRNAESYDRSKNVTFPANITSTGALTSTGAFTANSTSTFAQLATFNNSAVFNNSPGTSTIRFQHSGTDRGIFGIDGGIYGVSTANIGLYVYGVNDLELSTNGIKRLIAKGNGNILIGTTTDAGYKLDVNGTVRVQSNFVVDTDTLYVDATNNRVGIGTATPTDKLHIIDSSNANIFGRITATGTNASAAWVAMNNQNDNVVYRVFGDGVSGSQMGISLVRSASLLANLGGSGAFLIGTYSGTDMVFGTANVENMRISNNTGNLLIGTTTDVGNMLDVAGVINGLAYKVGNVDGWTGNIMIPSNPPGQQNIQVNGGIITNVF